jgi:hypothetical protein
MFEVCGIAGSQRIVEKKKCNKTPECIRMGWVKRGWNMVRTWYDINDIGLLLGQCNDSTGL